MKDLVELADKIARGAPLFDDDVKTLKAVQSLARISDLNYYRESDGIWVFKR